MQGERLLVSESGVDRQIDAYLCVIALSQLMRVAIAMKRATGDTSLREVCKRFQSDLPDAKNLRDILSHFNEYQRGAGKLKKARKMGELQVFMESGDGRFWLRVNDLKIELGSAVAGAQDLANAAMDASERFFRATRGLS